MLFCVRASQPSATHPSLLGSVSEWQGHCSAVAALSRPHIVILTQMTSQCAYLSLNFLSSCWKHPTPGPFLQDVIPPPSTYPKRDPAAVFKHISSLYLSNFVSIASAFPLAKPTPSVSFLKSAQCHLLNGAPESRPPFASQLQLPSSGPMGSHQQQPSSQSLPQFYPCCKPVQSALLG